MSPQDKHRRLATPLIFDRSSKKTRSYHPQRNQVQLPMSAATTFSLFFFIKWQLSRHTI